MTDTMLEKAARAICAERHGTDEATYVLLNGEERPQWPRYIDSARAALMAIREPVGLPFTNEVVDTEQGWETPRKVWTDTIDAILAGDA